MKDRYAVIGNPIAHSKSPIIHALFAEQTRQDLSYQAILMEPDHFSVHMQQLIAEGFRGFNITLPFKEKAYQLATDLSERARLAGAVNTLTPQSDGRLCGDNTDGVGLLRDLQQNLNITLENRRILLLGAGGAARGVAGVLLTAQPSCLVVANRTLDRAQTVAEAFTELGNITACALNEISNEPFDLVINATSSNLLGDAAELPNVQFTENGGCYDMSYGLPENPFLAWGQQHGAQWGHDGLGMLVEQAAESFFIWRGVRPETASVIQSLS
jgi:shikimate dehydrogenase